jgi:ribosomal-protein-serine acetyltransferase
MTTPFLLRSQRLILASPAPGDELVILEAITESFASLHEWLPWAKTMPTFEDVAQANADLLAKFRADAEFHFRIRREADQRYLGSIGVLYVDRGVPSMEMGFWLRSTARGQGYMQEAAQRLVQFVTEELRALRLQMRVDSRNVRSCALAERLGFSRGGVCQNAARDNEGRLLSHIIYALVRGAERPNPDGPANGSQPSRSETTRTSPAAGFRC